MPNYEGYPESEVVLSDTSLDGVLGITIWRDPTPVTESMRLRNIGAMGVVEVYDSSDGAIIYDRRLLLIEKYGSPTGLTEEEIAYWYKRIDRLPAEAA